VALAQGLFTELAVRLRATPADQLVTSRVRVPNPVKLRIAAVALAGRTPRSIASSTPTTTSKAAS
jgi:phytoene synthase